MMFDLTKEAPTSQAIETERRRLDSEIGIKDRAVTQRTKLRLLILVASLISSLLVTGMLWDMGAFNIYRAVVVGVIIIFGLGAEIFFAVFVKSVTVDLWVGVVACAVLLGFGTSIHLNEFAGLSVAIVYFCIYYVVNRPLNGWANELSDSRFLRLSLDDAADEKCIEISRWLDNLVIARYRDAVVSQGRLFVNGELDSMRSYMAGAEDRETVENARKAVYGAVTPGV